MSAVKMLHQMIEEQSNDFRYPLAGYMYAVVEWDDTADVVTVKKVDAERDLVTIEYADGLSHEIPHQHWLSLQPSLLM